MAKMIERRSPAGFTVLAPDYSVPGVKEAVAREVLAGEWRANPPRSSLAMLAAMRRDNLRDEAAIAAALAAADADGFVRCPTCGCEVGPDETPCNMDHPGYCITEHRGER